MIVNVTNRASYHCYVYVMMYVSGVCAVWYVLFPMKIAASAVSDYNDRYMQRIETLFMRI